MRIGIVTAAISRRAGGLFWAVRSLSQEVSRQGCEVSVYSVDDRFAADDIEQWQGLDITLCTTRGPASFAFAPGMGAALRMGQVDLVHAHGLWMYPSVVSSRWAGNKGAPRVVSPHGMLDPWAIRNSAVKKKLAGWAYENRHLRRATCLHALCDSEYESIRAYGLRNPVAIIPNGVELPLLSADGVEPSWLDKIPLQSRVLLFLGRIHPKKGLANLLHAWAQELRASHGRSWHLVVAGWDQNGNQAELEGLVEGLGIGSTVHFVGPQFEKQKLASLLRADAFVLPSFSEGLPMAVLEAWAHRLPVLMTSQCNLPEGFAADAAVPMEPNVESIRQGLGTLFEMSSDELAEMGSRGCALVEDRFTWPAVAAQMCSVYAWVLGQGPRPDCVRLD
ncbi:poly(glycerol-phosphate) alpha-glucosyltransferase [Thioalbus denitrificans]|uniref:Poly(Glycerol-phosphate) alpha-glucosyltransferase n=1 Tax=Thioalbus denitrificans TaxID=547122 RepID=A0A369CDX2_9GAMM|nr:poly(glycerol-phosphate) alpha-glucosyltransferase [Thioalbus denitrificans]